MVVEELVEGGMTRLAAFFYSQSPGRRPGAVDARHRHRHRLPAARACSSPAGGAPQTDRRIGAATSPTFSEGDRASTGRPTAPRRTTCSSHAPTSRDAGRRRTTPTPRRLSAVGSPSRLPAGQQGAAPSGRGSRAAHDHGWTLPGRHLRQHQHQRRRGRPVPGRHVLVLRVKVGDAGYLDPAHNPVPETYFTGKGQAMVFHGGRMVRGTVDQGRSRRAAVAVDQAGDLTRARRAHLDRAGAA